MPSVLLISILLLSGCGTARQGEAASQSKVALGQEFTLALGESTGIADQGVVIEFSKVLEDSRCPMNARCIWEGNAKLAFEVREPSAAVATIELNTSERFAQKIQLREFTLELIHLEPSRLAGAPTEGYAATLKGVSP